MIDTPSIDETINLLMRAHEGQFDKAGEPYWRHPIRVMARLVLRTPEISLEAMQAALLHDVIEDTKFDELSLLGRGYPGRVIGLVSALTRGRKDGMTYFQWIESLAQTRDRELMLIKLADNEDNADPARLAMLDVSIAMNLKNRYRKSAHILSSALASL